MLKKKGWCCINTFQNEHENHYLLHPLKKRELNTILVKLVTLFMGKLWEMNELIYEWVPMEEFNLKLHGNF